LAGLEKLVMTRPVPVSLARTSIVTGVPAVVMAESEAVLST